MWLPTIVDHRGCLPLGFGQHNVYEILGGWHRLYAFEVVDGHSCECSIQPTRGLGCMPNFKVPENLCVLTLEPQTSDCWRDEQFRVRSQGF